MAEKRDTHDRTVIVERRGGSGAAAIIAAVILVIVVIAAWYFLVGPGSSTDVNVNVEMPTIQAPAAPSGSG